MTDSKDVDADLKAFMVERYKALCARIDELREIGRQDEADKLFETEVKLLLRNILGENFKEE